MKKDLFVVKDTKMPAVLLEIGYLTNPHDESEMLTDDFQSSAATSIVEGIKEYKKESEKKSIFKRLFFWIGNLEIPAAIQIHYN